MHPKVTQRGKSSPIRVHILNHCALLCGSLGEGGGCIVGRTELKGETLKRELIGHDSVSGASESSAKEASRCDVRIRGGRGVMEKRLQ